MKAKMLPVLFLLVLTSAGSIASAQETAERGESFAEPALIDAGGIVELPDGAKARDAVHPDNLVKADEEGEMVILDFPGDMLIASAPASLGPDGVPGPESEDVTGGQKGTAHAEQGSMTTASLETSVSLLFQNMAVFFSQIFHW